MTDTISHAITVASHVLWGKTHRDWKAVITLGLTEPWMPECTIYRERDDEGWERVTSAGGDTAELALKNALAEAVKGLSHLPMILEPRSLPRHVVSIAEFLEQNDEGGVA